MKFYTKTYSEEVSSKEERHVDDKLNPQPYPRDGGLCQKKNSAKYKILSKEIKIKQKQAKDEWLKQNCADRHIDRYSRHPQKDKGNI